jgi:hypothetical protein
VERLCVHLAERVEANGSKRPTISKEWRDAARLMIDKDQRTEEQIHTAIDWCQDDEFWHANVLSMPSLRKRYDQLRLKARQQKRTSVTPQPAMSTADQRVAAAQALKSRPVADQPGTIQGELA